MEPVAVATLPRGTLILVDTPPIIYQLEAHPRLAQRFRAAFERQAAGEILFAVTTLTIAEVLTGPLAAAEIAESAARLRASLSLKLPDAVQAASAIAVNADALMTHDRDFSRLKSLPVLA